MHPGEDREVQIRMTATGRKSPQHFRAGREEPFPRGLGRREAQVLRLTFLFLQLREWVSVFSLWQ